MSTITVLHFDGLRNSSKAAYGFTLQNTELYFRGNGVLPEPCTCNEAEYTALIKGLKKYIELNLKDDYLVIKGDSRLVIEQVKGNWVLRAPNLIKFHKAARQLLPVNSSLYWIPREQNKEADSLANLAC